MITENENEIIQKLKCKTCCDIQKITQDQFDIIVDYITKNHKDSKKLIWSLCECNADLNLNKVVDLFIDTKDIYYVSEFVSYFDDNLDQEYFTKKLLKTDDLEFIKNIMSYCGNQLMGILDKKYINQINCFIEKK